MIMEIPTLRQLFFSFLQLGAVSFGGPGMVAYIKRLSVSRKNWLSEEDFKQSVALYQVMPGATAMHCAAYVGWRKRGFWGAIATYTGFGLPAFFLMFALSVGQLDPEPRPHTQSALYAHSSPMRLYDVLDNG